MSDTAVRLEQQQPPAATTTAAPQVPAVLPRYLQFTFGGLAGMGATMIVQPFDVVKTRMQLSQRAHGVPTEGVLRMLGNLLKAGGVRELYAGLSAALFRQVTYTTTRLGAFGIITDELTRYRATRALSSSSSSSPSAAPSADAGRLSFGLWHIRADQGGDRLGRTAGRSYRRARGGVHGERLCGHLYLAAAGQRQDQTAEHARQRIQRHAGRAAKDRPRRWRAGAVAGLLALLYAARTAHGGRVCDSGATESGLLADGAGGLGGIAGSVPACICGGRRLVGIKRATMGVIHDVDIVRLSGRTDTTTFPRSPFPLRFSRNGAQHACPRSLRESLTGFPYGGSEASSRADGGEATAAPPSRPPATRLGAQRATRVTRLGAVRRAHGGGVAVADGDHGHEAPAPFKPATAAAEVVDDRALPPSNHATVGVRRAPVGTNDPVPTARAMPPAPATAAPPIHARRVRETNQDLAARGAAILERIRARREEAQRLLAQRQQQQGREERSAEPPHADAQRRDTNAPPSPPPAQEPLAAAACDRLEERRGTEEYPGVCYPTAAERRERDRPRHPPHGVAPSIEPATSEPHTPRPALAAHVQWETELAFRATAPAAATAPPPPPPQAMFAESEPDWLARSVATQDATWLTAGERPADEDEHQNTLNAGERLMVVAAAASRTENRTEFDEGNTAPWDAPIFADEEVTPSAEAKVNESVRAGSDAHAPSLPSQEALTARLLSHSEAPRPYHDDRESLRATTGGSCAGSDIGVGDDGQGEAAFRAWPQPEAAAAVEDDSVAGPPFSLDADTGAVQADAAWATDSQPLHFASALVEEKVKEQGQTGETKRDDGGATVDVPPEADVEDASPPADVAEAATHEGWERILPAAPPASVTQLWMEISHGASFFARGPPPDTESSVFGAHAQQETAAAEHRAVERRDVSTTPPPLDDQREWEGRTASDAHPEVPTAAAADSAADHSASTEPPSLLFDAEDANGPAAVKAATDAEPSIAWHTVEEAEETKAPATPPAEPLPTTPTKTPSPPSTLSPPVDTTSSSSSSSMATDPDRATYGRDGRPLCPCASFASGGYLVVSVPRTPQSWPAATAVGNDSNTLPIDADDALPCSGINTDVHAYRVASVVCGSGVCDLDVSALERWTGPLELPQAGAQAAQFAEAMGQAPGWEADSAAGVLLRLLAHLGRAWASPITPDGDKTASARRCVELAECGVLSERLQTALTERAAAAGPSYVSTEVLQCLLLGAPLAAVDRARQAGDWGTALLLTSALQYRSWEAPETTSTAADHSVDDDSTAMAREALRSTVLAMLQQNEEVQHSRGDCC
eukprot:ctg_898.g388